MKVRTGRLAVDLAAIGREAELSHYQFLSLKRTHLKHLLLLPKHHGDPFDHLLLAQAAFEHLTLLTNDAAMARYGIPTFA